jgi:hypothetical protein
LEKQVYPSLKIYGSSINDVTAAGERVDDFKKKLIPDKSEKNGGEEN